jgi:hypothetical protein
MQPNAGGQLRRWQAVDRDKRRHKAAEAMCVRPTRWAPGASLCLQANRPAGCLVDARPERIAGAIAPRLLTRQRRQLHSLVGRLARTL